MARRRVPFLSRACFKPTSEDELGILSTGFDGSGLGLGYTQVWHKRDLDQYTVVSEYVAGEIATYLRLPIQPFAVTHFELPDERIPVFSSLDFNYERANHPEIDAAACLEHLPEVCAGILIFDVLVGNEDRTTQNMVADDIRGPKRVIIFDHGTSLLRGYATDDKGAARLTRIEDRLGITKVVAGHPIPHVFLERITTCRHMDNWIERIFCIPEWFIREICSAARKQVGTSAADCKALADFLCKRRKCLDLLVRAARHEFKAIADWDAQAAGSLF